MKKLLFPLLLYGLCAFGQKTQAPDPVDPKSPSTPQTGPIQLIRLPAGLPTTPPPGTAHLAATMIYKEEDINISNETSATAMALGGTAVKVKANIYPAGDVDYYSFTAGMGDRVYVGIMTSKSSNASLDSYLELIDTDGTTVLETDLDDGVFGATSSAIAGFPIPAAGTYFLKVRHNAASTQLRPYFLYFKLQSGTPTAETEPNDPFPGQALPASGWVSGETSSAADEDYYSVTLNAGETIFLSLDLDPERDGVEWNGQLGFGSFGTPPLIVPANDAGTGTPDSETLFFTVKEAGTYSISVRLGGGAAFGTYHLSAAVLPPDLSPAITYASTDVPVTIPTGPDIVTSTLTIPGNPIIKKLRVSINLTHNFMADLDAQLTAPGGNTIGLFSDIGSVTVGAQTTMNLKLNEDAALPPLFNVVQDMELMPESGYNLGWFKGQNAGGTWTLTLRDDAAGDGGELHSWSIEVIEESAVTVGSTIFSSDFEANDGGFTHSGTLDEWEWGSPTAVPVDGANSGSNCWKTDLDNNYENSSNQELLSPNIIIPTLGAGTKAYVRWAMKYQIERPDFDHAYIKVREVSNPTNEKIVWLWLDADMVDNVGNPIVAIQEAAGWGIHIADISEFSGKTVEILFHLDSDNTVQRGGLAIDDVSVFTDCDVSAVPQLSMSNPSSVCSGTGASLSATCTAPATVKWYDAAGMTLLFTGSPFSTPNLTAATAYKVRCENASCLSNFVDVSIAVDQPAILDAGPDQTICAGSTVQLAAVLSGAATSGVWSLHPNHGTWSPLDTDPHAVYTPSAAEVMAGTATLTFNTNDPAGVCPGVSDQVTIFINPAATALAGPDQFVCATSPSVTLAGSFSGSAATATWSGAGTFSPNNTTLNAVYTPSAAEILAGTATLTLTTDDPAGICPAGSDQMTIFIGAAAILDAGPDQVICAGSTVQLAAVLSGAATSGVWSLHPNHGTWSPLDTDPNAIYTPSAAEVMAGTATLTYNTNDPVGACPGVSDQVTITINPASNSALSASKVDVCPNTEVTLSPNCSIPTATVQWSPGAPTVIPNAPDLAYTYSVSCTANGCTGNTSSVVVRTHRILADLKNVGTGPQPKALAGAVKDNLAPTNTINMPTSPRLWTIVATGCSASESAVFKLTGPVNFSSIDNNPPYALFANVGSDYFGIDHPNYGNGGSFPNGTYTLTVDLRGADGVGGPFPKNRVATGPLLATRTLQFTLVNPPRVGVDESVAVETAELKEEAWLSVGQNPVSTEVVVRLSGKIGQTIDLSLTNLQGQTIQQRSVVLNSVQQYEVLNVAQAASGMYILKGLKAGEAKTLKVVKMP
ncbi:MAG: proprotein convertase P-domain-containing protein [Spirosomataceae bacterium]